MVFVRDPWSRYGVKMRLRKTLTRHFGLNLVPPHYLLAQYPTFHHLASFASRVGFDVVEEPAGRSALVLRG